MKNIILTTILIGSITIATAQNNLGVNQPNPTAKTHITNTENQNSLQVDDEANDATPFVVDSLGNVGVQTESPTVELEVNGRIKDKTGFVLPVGSVISFAGVNIPEGWMLCDGSSFTVPVQGDSLFELFSAIENAWGGDGIATFNIPQMQGMFLRGTDNGTGNDPDVASRTESNTGGNTGDSVGSSQIDEFKSHNHQETRHDDNPNSGQAVSGGGVLGNTLEYPNTGNTGGSETRPKNVNVNFIIKY